MMQHHGLTDQQRDLICQHRKYCLSCAKHINSPEKLDVTEIATATSRHAGRSAALPYADGLPRV
ncbi:hypothetical protein [Enterobacter sp. KBR-315C3_2022]|uniref:hypothetical protein n=1 Tax=Enterobacter sp. KBR-315C3_2022 TaxID=3242494 RepID=UPI0035293BAC